MNGPLPAATTRSWRRHLALETQIARVWDLEETARQALCTRLQFRHFLLFRTQLIARRTHGCLSAGWARESEDKQGCSQEEN